MIYPSPPVVVRKYIVYKYPSTTTKFQQQKINKNFQTQFYKANHSDQFWRYMYSIVQYTEYIRT